MAPKILDKVTYKYVKTLANIGMPILARYWHANIEAILGILANIPPLLGQYWCDIVSQYLRNVVFQDWRNIGYLSQYWSRYPLSRQYCLNIFCYSENHISFKDKGIMRL